MVRRVILLVGEETSVFRSENIWSFYHQLILGQGHVRCIFPAGQLRKCAVVPCLGHSLFNCWCRKCQGARLHSHTGGDTDRGKWTVPAPLFSRKGREHEGWSSSCLKFIFLLSRSRLEKPLYSTTKKNDPKN